MKKLMGLNIAPFVLLIVGVLLIVQGIRKNGKWDRMEAGIVKPGILRSSPLSLNGGEPKYFFHVSFEPTPGNPIIGKFRVSESRYNTETPSLNSASIPKLPKKPIEVKFNPDDPSEAYLVGEERRNRPMPLPLWILLGGFLIAMGAWTLRNVLKAGELIQEADVGDAVKSGFSKTLRQMFLGR